MVMDGFTYVIIGVKHGRSLVDILKNGETGYGRLYLADISRLEPVPDTSEIAEIKKMGTFPENVTHPDIQPHLYKRILEHLESKS
jgi:hypothetical protein